MRALSILFAGLTLFLGLLTVPAECAALEAETAGGTSTDAELFEQATTATAKGAFSEAISLFERLSDRGAHHPDTSFNRAIAYWQRAESPKKQPGDLGQAAAGFAEAAALPENEREAKVHLQTIHQEISRDRSRRGLDPVVVRPPIGRALVGLLPESVWAVVTLLGSLALAVGLFLRRKSASHLRLAGQINTYAGALVVMLFASLTLAAREFRVNGRDAIVIVHEARLLDQGGKALKLKALDVETKAIPEGASLIVVGQRGRLLQIVWGNTEAWVKSSDVRLIAGNL